MSQALLATPVEELTPQERRVLGHVASGATNRDIAAALDIGEATVKTHLAAARRKLGARDRAHAAAVAVLLALDGPDVSAAGA